MNPFIAVVSFLVAAASASYEIPLASSSYSSSPSYGNSYNTQSYQPIKISPESKSSQYQTLDGYGNFKIGYKNVNSQREEVRTADGGVKGSYSYTDGYGVARTVSYVADKSGYRVVSANNQPYDASAQVGYTPEVQQAREAHFAAHQAALNRHRRQTTDYKNSASTLNGVSSVGSIGSIGSSYGGSSIGSIGSSYGGSSIGSSYGGSSIGSSYGGSSIGSIGSSYGGSSIGSSYGGSSVGSNIIQSSGSYSPSYPTSIGGGSSIGSSIGSSVGPSPSYGNNAPVYNRGSSYEHEKISPASSSSQYRKQDGQGNVDYGFTTANQQRHESRNSYGGSVGSYGYKDAYGNQQRLDYVADSNGFRVTSGTNLPIGPANVYQGAVGETPEVAKLRQQHLAIHAKEAQRNLRGY